MYLDTEFNGFGGDLISLALVSEPVKRHQMLRHLGETTSHEFYRAVLCKGPVDSWVQQNVMPVLRIAPLMPALFRGEFHDFISKYDNPEIICDWHADAAHFCNMLAGPDYGTSLDFPCKITILKTPSGQPVSATPHNALEDARALMNWHTGLLEKAA